MPDLVICSSPREEDVLFIPPILGKYHPLFKKKRSYPTEGNRAPTHREGFIGWAIFGPNGKKYSYQWSQHYQAWRRTTLPMSIFEPVNPPSPLVILPLAEEFVGWN